MALDKLMFELRRRAFIALLGATMAGWPLRARAQQGGRVRRMGVLIGLAEGDPEIGKHLSAFRGGLRALGWTDGQNVQIDHRVAGDPAGMRSAAVELTSLGPELIVTFSTPATNAVREARRNVPIVFIAVSDPIGTGFVESFARPGGNITGFTNFEGTIGGKWLELMRDIAPSIRRASMLFNPATANTGASGGVYLQSMQAAAQIRGIELIVSPVNDPADIDGVFAAMAEGPPGGVIVMPNVFTAANRDRIVAQAERFRIPTVYPLLHFVAAGGLLSYGVDISDLFRRAASYVDRILKGGKPADLPVQQPTKFELMINLKTAKALGLNVPLTLLAQADNVIE
ncbi:MAG TPA: ABC transporter substrate-binding protein [Xanthobacteraceae bacterium]